MFGFGQKNAGVIYGILVDVGSGSLGVGIVESHNREPMPRVIYANRQYMRVTKSNANHDARLREMRQALFSSLLELSKNGLVALREHDPNAHLSRMYVTCSAPWGKTVTQTVSYTDEDEFKVTDEIIRDLIKDADEEIGQAHTGDETDTRTLTVVERATIDVRVNGYSVHTPVGIKGIEVSLSHISGLIPNDVLDAINEAHQKFFPETAITTHTSMLILYLVIQDLFPHTESLLAVDVTGEATEFGVIENGLLVDTAYAPYGTNTLVRDVVERTGKTTADVTSVFREFTRGTFSKETNDAVARELSVYHKAISVTLDTLRDTHHLPRTVALVVPTTFASVIQHIVPKTLNDMFANTYTILPVDERLIKELATTQTEPDLNLSVAGQFFHKMNKKNKFNER